MVHRSVKEKGWRMGKEGGRRTIDLVSKQKQKEKTRKKEREGRRRGGGRALPSSLGDTHREGLSLKVGKPSRGEMGELLTLKVR